MTSKDALVSIAQTVMRNRHSDLHLVDMSILAHTIIDTARECAPLIGCEPRDAEVGAAIRELFNRYAL